MLPPVFDTLNVASITTLVGTNPVRIYDFDSAPEGVQTPYITWFAGANEPHDNISDAPSGDTDPVQINCYTGPADAGRAQARALGLAVRNALDAAGIHSRVIINTRETDTKLFRVSLEADFIHQR